MKISSKNLFFTSDSHWGHYNIIKYCNRPFNSVLEMQEALIEKWNQVVPKNGIVFHLGDIFICNQRIANDILGRLNGSIYLIQGNHDQTINKIVKNCHKYNNSTKIIKMESNYFITIIEDNQHIHLYHYPISSWNKKNHNSWHLHGHCHSNLDNSNETLNSKRLDVGVDSHDFYPLSYEKVKEILTSKASTYNGVG